MSTTRTCPSCGAAASASERFCASCGTRLPEASPAVTPTLALGTPGDTPAPAAPPDNTMRLPADAPPAPPKRKGLPIWAIALLGLAGLCGLSCVAVAVFFAFVGQQVVEVSATAIVEELATVEAELTAPPAAPATATSQVILALPTAEPAAGGVGGALPGGAAGAAAQVQTVEAATAVAAATAETAALFGEARVIFQDEFVDNRNAWFVGVFEEIETDRIEDGVFKVIWAGKGNSYELYEVRELGNFIAEVDCLVRAGGTDGSCGLIFAQSADGYYKYELFDDYFRLFLVQADAEPQLLVEGDPTGAVRPGDVNRLRVVRRGADIALFVNQAPLATAADLTFLSGKVGVSTNSYLEEGGVEIWFDNFIIWELPG